MDETSDSFKSIKYPISVVNLLDPYREKTISIKNEFELIAIRQLYSQYIEKLDALIKKPDTRDLDNLIMFYSALNSEKEKALADRANKMRLKV